MTDRNWAALVIRFGCEAEVEKEFRLVGVDYFSPKHTKWRKLPKHRARKEGRTRELVVTELTPGYIFIRGTAAGIAAIVNSHRYIVDIVRIGEDVCWARDGEMDAFRQACESGLFDDIQKQAEPKQEVKPVEPVEIPRDLQSFLNKFVKVKTGPLKGLTGRVKEVRGKALLLDGQVKVALSASQVEETPE